MNVTKHSLRWIATAGLLVSAGLAMVEPLSQLNAGAAATASAPAWLPADMVVRPLAVGQTDPVPHDGDAADDPAIWIHPTDPAASLIIGTDKQGGLEVYDLSGKLVQTADKSCKPNNVDVIYGFKLGDRTVDIAVASTRGSSGGVKVWRIDQQTGKLDDATAGGTIKVLGGEPYGICGYRDAKDGRCYFFVNNKDGAVEQHRLDATADGKIGSTVVRKLKLKSTTEGCVADNELGVFYIAEESTGIWKFPAAPDGGDKGQLVAKVGEHGLTADVEGLTIYYASAGKGYLIASSQGNSTFKVYERQGDNRFLLTIDPADGKIDDVSDTDGIDVTNRPTSTTLPAGFFVVQDGSNRGGKQNFKIYDWRDIAGKWLITDTQLSPRAK